MREQLAAMRAAGLESLRVFFVYDQTAALGEYRDDAEAPLATWFARITTVVTSSELSRLVSWGGWFLIPQPVCIFVERTSSCLGERLLTEVKAAGGGSSPTSRELRESAVRAQAQLIAS